MRAVLILFVVGCFSLASGCGEKGGGDGSGGQPSTGGQASTGSGPSDGETGGNSSGGAATGGTGGTTSGGAGGVGGAPPGGTGGVADPYEGYPDWVQDCASQRITKPCPSCLDPECIVCTYGTDEEIEDTEAVCSAPSTDYAAYCDCVGCANSMGGVCRFP